MNDNIKIKALFIAVLFGIAVFIGNQKLKIPTNVVPKQQNLADIYNQVANQVLPINGFQTNLVFGDSIKKLVEAEVIDLEKFKELYKARGGLSDDILEIMTNGSNKPIVINDKTAPLYLNLLWALGLSNKTEFNQQSPVNGKDLFNFASTGGWNLGKKDNGGYYFNQVEAIKLTQEQEKLVLEVAQNTFRPCCDNSTFFQDCNHGSALLGALELAANQGYTKDELYKLALRFNSFWFPDNYIKTALYFKIFNGKDWSLVDSKEVMGFKYSSASGWTENVNKELLKFSNTNSPGGGGASCGV